MRTFVVLILVFLSGLPGLVGAEERTTEGEKHRQRLERQLLDRDLGEEEVKKMVETMTAAGFSLEEMERLGEQLATGGHLLRQTALDKIREGIAKGAPPQAIVAATEKVRNRLEIATQLATSLRHRDDQTIVEGFADGLAAGLRQEQAIHLANALKAATTSGAEAHDLTAETVLYARDMARRRVDSVTVVEVLTSLLSQKISAREMQQLRQDYAAGSGNPQQQAKGPGPGFARENPAGGQQGESGGMGAGSAGQGRPGDGGSGGGGGGGGGRR